MIDLYERKQAAIRNLKGNPDFKAVLDWLRSESWWGQGPWDAAGFEPHRAAYIEGRQSLIRLIDIEFEEEYD